MEKQGTVKSVQANGTWDGTFVYDVNQQSGQPINTGFAAPQSSVGRDLSIIRQSSLKVATEFVCKFYPNGKAEDVISVADIFVNWVNGEAKSQRVEKAKQAVEEAVEKMAQSDLPF